MKSRPSVRLALAAAAVSFSAALTPAQTGAFADAVVHYEPGSGVPARFTDAESALGAPSTVNPFGEPTDPFNPPYGTNQIVSVGAGGSLVLRFHNPIHNHPNNPRGLDFVIFGNAGFIITNAFDPDTFEWIGIPATDGSMFGTNPGETRVSVSRDGVTFHTLHPEVAPTVDGAFPPDAAGVPGVPTLPTLDPGDFAGATLEDIRTLYRGSAGGAAYDIDWAVDDLGRRVHLPTIQFIRIDVISGRSEIDAVGVTARKAARNGSK